MGPLFRRGSQKSINYASKMPDHEQRKWKTRTHLHVHTQTYRDTHTWETFIKCQQQHMASALCLGTVNRQHMVRQETVVCQMGRDRGNCFEVIRLYV